MTALALLRSPTLPAPITAFLFENHWPYWILLLAVAAILFYFSNIRQDPRLRTAAFIVAAITLVWTLLALTIDTPAERLYNAHRALADATKSADVDRIVSFLAPDFHASALDVSDINAAKDEIAARLKTYGIKSSSIRFYQSTLEGPTAFTQLNVLTQSDAGPILTSWHLTWNDLPNSDWKIRSAELTKVGDQDFPQNSVIPK